MVFAALVYYDTNAYFKYYNRLYLKPDNPSIVVSTSKIILLDWLLLHLYLNSRLINTLWIKWNKRSYNKNDIINCWIKSRRHDK